MSISGKTKKLLLFTAIITAVFVFLTIYSGGGKEKITFLLRPQDSSEKYELEAYVGGEIIDIEGDIGKRKYTGEEAKSELKNCLTI